jgi:hypothetical protein
MGLFFERTAHQSPITDLVRVALLKSPPTNPEAEAARIASEYLPLIRTLTTMLKTTPPDTQAAIASTSKEAADELLGDKTFNTVRFLVATGIFVVLVIAAVATDVADLKSSPAALYALATTVFGIVVGFLSAEKPQ